MSNIHVTEEELHLHCELIEESTSTERDMELQEQGYIKIKGKWYRCTEED